MRKIVIVCLLTLLAFSSCYRLPDLHLYDVDNPGLAFPIVEVNLDTYWDYDITLGMDYNWRSEWFYGWDEEDRRRAGDRISHRTYPLWFCHRQRTELFPFSASCP